jgi:hypothetical protein
VDVYESPGIPSVDMNGIWISPSDPFYRLCDPYRFLDDDLDISCGDSVELRVTYAKFDGTPGSARANVILPGQFEITSPDTCYDTISIGESLVFRWTLSNGADAYVADFRLAYSYRDTLGNRQYFDYTVYDTVFTDTFITFSQVQLYPNLEAIDSLEYGYGDFQLSAMNGPAPEEDEGNVIGDAIGFFNGWTYGGYVYIRFGNGGTLTNEREERGNPMVRLAKQRARRTNL